MKHRISQQLFNSIAAQLLRVIFACYFVVTVIVTCVQLTLEYQDTQERLLRDMQALQQTFNPSINDAVWGVNDTGLQSILSGMMQQPIVIGVKVVDAGNRIIAAKGIVQDDSGNRFTVDADNKLLPIAEKEEVFAKVLSQTFPVMHTDALGTSEIGKWTVYSSQKFVVNQVKFGFMLLLINAVIKTVALWFIFVFVVNRLLGLPLKQLSAFVGRLTIDNLGQEVLVLKNHNRNELNLLADKIRELQESLNSSISRNAALYAQLQAEQAATKELNVHLEERVAQRTQALSVAYHAAEAAREELAEMLERLQKTQSELLESEKLASLGSLVAGVSHELNTPIGVALTTASTMEYDISSFRQAVEGGAVKKSYLNSFLQRNAEMGQLLVQSCHRAADLVSSFKQVAVDQTSERRRTFNLLELVENNLATLRPSLKHEKWSIRVDIPPDIVCASYPGPLGQVLVNMIQNTARHAFEGRDGGTVQISAKRVADAVEMVIADDGAGMPPGTLAHIFEPFFTTRLGQGGSGLGLTISRNIVIGLLGGTIQAHSELGVGTTMVLTFPLIAPQAEKLPKPSSNQADTSSIVNK